MRRLLAVVALVAFALAMSTSLESGPVAKKPVYQCNDRIDNDSDGLTDYPADPQCIGAYDYNELPQCSDGIDNDGSGAADYPADVDGCLSPEDDLEADLPVTECSDRYDNDLDGRIDFPSDPGCKSHVDLSEQRNKSPSG